VSGFGYAEGSAPEAESECVACKSVTDGGEAPSKKCDTVARLCSYLVDQASNSEHAQRIGDLKCHHHIRIIQFLVCLIFTEHEDRKSTRLNSSHVKISYAVFCLKKKKTVKK